MGGVFAKALGRLVGKQEMRILMVRAPTARRENRSPQLPRAFSSPLDEIGAPAPQPARPPRACGCARCVES